MYVTFDACCLLYLPSFQAQRQYEAGPAVTYPQPGGASQYPPQQPPMAQSAGGSLYPTLDEYMGLQLTPQFVQQNLPAYVSDIYD